MYEVFVFLFHYFFFLHYWDWDGFKLFQIYLRDWWLLWNWNYNYCNISIKYLFYWELRAARKLWSLTCQWNFILKSTRFGFCFSFGYNLLYSRSTKKGKTKIKEKSIQIIDRFLSDRDIDSFKLNAWMAHVITKTKIIYISILSSSIFSLFRKRFVSVVLKDDDDDDWINWFLENIAMEGGRTLPKCQIPLAKSVKAIFLFF